MSKRIKPQGVALVDSSLTSPDSAPPAVYSKAPKGSNLEAGLALLKRGFTKAEAARELDISKQAFGQMLKRSGCDVEKVESYKRDKNIIFNAKQKLLTDALNSKVISKMDGKSLLIGVGIIQDKLRDMENPARAGFGGANLWVNIVQASHRPEKVIETSAEEVGE